MQRAYEGAVREEFHVVFLANVRHAVQRARVDEGELRDGAIALSRAGDGRLRMTTHTCTWFETIDPGPKEAQISSVWMASKLHRPMAVILPSFCRSWRCCRAVR